MISWLVSMNVLVDSGFYEEIIIIIIPEFVVVEGEW